MTQASTQAGYAVNLLNRGYGVQNAAAISGMDVERVQALSGARTLQRASYRPPAPPPVSAVPYGPPRPTPAQQVYAVVDGVARRRGLRHRDMISACRWREIAWTRQEAMATLRERFGLSMPRIGQILGGRDHTTVLHGIRKHEERAAWAAVVVQLAKVAT